MFKVFLLLLNFSTQHKIKKITLNFSYISRISSLIMKNHECTEPKTGNNLHKSLQELAKTHLGTTGSGQHRHGLLVVTFS